MKDVSIYFSPINVGDTTYEASQLGSRIIEVENSTENLERGSVAFVFVDEYRNSDINPDQDDFSYILDKIYKLEGGSWQTEIYNLGKIKPGNSSADTFVAVKEVVSELVKHDIIPLVIGGSQDLTYAVYQGYAKLEQTINLMTIDAEFDLGDPEGEISHNAWLNKIIMDKSSLLFNYTNLGYQSYYVKEEELSLFNTMFFDTHRLGDFYSNTKMVEPLVRNSDILSFDLNAIRSSDYKGNSKDSPHGFYGEDACSIMRYAGLSDKLTSLGIFNFNSTDLFVKQDANLVAQMVWYFVEGVNHRNGDYPKCTKKKYTKYRVSIDDFKDEIIFYKSNKSARWWMEVPYPNSEKLKFQRHFMIPCTYEAYQAAQQNEMPDLWWKTYQKLV
jgi:arginase family enzyme